jgi:glycosyltransferase involved in cell wall biosynthesis
MKVCFKLIRGGSGSDTWTYHIAATLKSLGVETVVEEFPHYFQYLPFLANTSLPPETDIVHTNSWNGFRFKVKNVPMVTTEHLVIHDPLISPYKSFSQKVFHKIVYQFEKFSFKSADAITAVSNYSNEQVKKIFAVQSTAIQNGIDIDKFNILPNTQELNPELANKTKLLFVGNFTTRKGADLLPKILSGLGDDYVLLTTSGLRDKSVVEHNNIISIGKLNQDQLVEYYNYCDVFLFPTRLEGLSLTTLEAMACGMPVVTTNCFSMPELVVDKKGGFLCEQDNVDEFVAAVKKISTSPQLGKEMSLYNRQHIKNYFSIKAMAEKYITLYKQILSNE